MLRKTAIAFAIFLPANVQASGMPSDDLYDKIQNLGTAIEYVRSHYVEPVDDEQLINAAIAGMMKSLDPHSSYLPPVSYDAVVEQSEGSFGGIGVTLRDHADGLEVVSVMPSSPAGKGGILAGDIIQVVDGTSIAGLQISEAVSMMRGDPGSSITIDVLRDASIMSVDISRAVIDIPVVTHTLLGDLGYIHITAFSGKTAAQLNDALQSMKTAKGYLIDLRGNPGGLLDAASEASDLLLESGDIVSIRGRDSDVQKLWQAGPGDIGDGKPLVILVDRTSASASEIMAGAIQDNSRGIVVGEKTFGKGSVQTVLPLPDGAALRLTTARYYTPAGRSIQKVGIIPDIHIPQGTLSVEDTTSQPYDEAHLNGALDNEIPQPEPRRRSEDTANLTKDDAQLARALDILRTLILQDAS